jgi:NADPH-dependent 2,4-dienoyl-CoA reductase/sulfur reductase-like enzyme
MVFPSPCLCNRVFPADLGNAIRAEYHRRGIEIATADRPDSITRKGERFVTRTQNGRLFESDMLIVGVGVSPELSLAQSARLRIDNGIVVNERLETSHPDIYAAGDNALFPYQALGQPMRVEHWDNAMIQGRSAGRNMAGAGEPYAHMPYFFSDLFEFGYEAVGEVSTELEVFADWQKPNDTGVIYYLRDGRVRGAMMCNVWNKVDQARQMIRKGEKVPAPAALAGAIR